MGAIVEQQVGFTFGNAVREPAKASLAAAAGCVPL